MSGLARRHIEPISKMTYRQLPRHVVDRTKLLIAHCLGSACFGLDEVWTKAARGIRQDLGLAGTARIWFTGDKGSALMAAYINGVAAQSSGQEDVHRESAAHGGIVILPTALSLADALGSSGQDLILSLAASYELLCRLGRAGADPEITRRGFRPTTVFGVFATTLAAGILMKLDTDQLVSAVGISGNYCCGVNEWAKAGTDDIFVQNGLCATAGILSAGLAKNGLRGSEYMLEGSDGRSGVGGAFGFAPFYLEAAPVFDGSYSIADVVCKSSPSCLFTQTTARVAELAVRDGVTADQVESGIIWAPRRAKEYGYCDNPGPFKGLIQARNSHQYVAASALVYGSITNAGFMDYQNPAISRLAARLRVEVKPEYDSLFPDKQSGTLELKLLNGQIRSYYLEDSHYLTDNQVWQLYRENLSRRVLVPRIDAISDKLEKLETLSNVQEFTRLLAAE